MIIENAWNEFKNECIVDEVNTNVYQLKVMRTAFFAGFSVMLRFAKSSPHLDCTVLDAEIKKEIEEAAVQ